MFTEGNLVRLITEDGTGEVMRVLKDSDGDSGVTYVSNGFGNDDSDDWVDTADLELVTDDPLTHEECKPQSPNAPNRTEEDIHNDISKMFIQVVQWLQANGCERQIELTINADYHQGSAMDIGFKVQIGYDSTITSKNLFRSAAVALNRHDEDKSLSPLSIPMFVEK